MRTHLILTLALLTATACGAPADKDDDVIVINNANSTTNDATNGASNNVPDPDSPAGRIKAGIAVPQAAQEAGTGSLELLAEGVFLASQLANGGVELVTTGTLTQQGQQLEFTYDAQPNDRLRVVWTEGDPTEFFVSTFEGDFSDDATAFVNSDHSVDFRVERAGVADLQVSSQRVDGESQGSVVGTVTVDGVLYDVDLNAAGTYSSQVEIDSAQHESDERFTGTITATDGFEATIDETYGFELFVFENGITNEERIVNNTWSVDGDSYAAQNVRIRFETLNGWANLTDYWIVEGGVTRNGEAVGQMVLEETEAWISIYVDLGDGERVEVQRFLHDPNR